MKEQIKHVRENLQIRYSTRLKNAQLKERIDQLANLSGLSASHIIGSLLLSGLEAAERDPSKLIIKVSPKQKTNSHEEKKA